jgi:nitroimidazol reductase NimA-like FMN-containing flavoprotein (pyridoxamine 5'-phosphate oxidase superfamily)
MNNKEKQALAKIKILCESQSLAVLATQKNDQPYASLVAFAATENLEQIIFLTPNTTRKFDNIDNNFKVAVLINDSKNQADDIHNAISVTATGTAAAIYGHEKDELLEVYLKRHPHLKTFSAAPTTAVIRVTVDRYFMVSRFQNVVEIQVTS